MTQPALKLDEQPDAGSAPLPDLPVVGIDWTAIREEYRTGLLSTTALAAKHGITEGAIRHRAKRHLWPRDLTAATQLATRDKLLRATRLAALNPLPVYAPDPNDPRRNPAHPEHQTFLNEVTTARANSIQTRVPPLPIPVDPTTIDPSDPSYLDPKSQAFRDARSAYTRAVAANQRLARASESAGIRPARAPIDGRTDDEVADEAAEVGAAVVLSHRRDIRQQRQLVSLLLAQLQDVAVSRESIGEMITANVPPTHYVKRLAMEKACALPSHAAIMRDLTTAQRHLVVLERQAFNIGQETGGGKLEDWLDKLDPT